MTTGSRMKLNMLPVESTILRGTNGFADLKRDEEVLELLEIPVGTAPKNTAPGKGRRFKSGRPHQKQANCKQALCPESARNLLFCSGNMTLGSSF
jgi:hypothetical protein